ncbi:glycosyltransferase [Flavobacterium sp.]|uniref:glycosyltransferase n=1 Tax=Flavobacterium sp. TaxID=239 RepID=UPI0026311569|nr:glycosyltransferase [Flavobacterium sp.]MDD3004335.1 glycosyltransferase [Flavobacterium sp.]
MLKTAIIIPCYNEEKRIQKDKILELVSRSEVTVYLTNDGSSDRTLAVLTSLSQENNNQIKVINFEKNEGKAAAIYKSIHLVRKENQFDYIGYFDADFSTPVAEITRLLDFNSNNQVLFIFGSRVKLLNSNIKRKVYRHIIGRVIITIINWKFRLAIYDTQCGAKLFSNQIIEKVFTKPFYTSWLFDVEIFIRLKNLNLLHSG